jgi:putative photosynthetic complex assembly protein 2
MVTGAALILPFAAVTLLWFVSTGLVAMIHHRMRASFARALVIASVCGAAGLALIFWTHDSRSSLGAYASFLGGLLIWSWHEISFLTGAVAGSHRDPCPPDARGWDRFARATTALLHHEIALAMTAALLLSLAAVTANPTGAYCFALLLIFRLSAKLNIFWGVPSLSDELLPLHLAYLKSYFGPKRLSPMLPISIAAIAALGGWFGWSALTAPTAHLAVQASLLCCLCLLGALEHLFLAMRFRDSALWSWAMAPLPARISNERE